MFDYNRFLWIYDEILCLFDWVLREISSMALKLWFCLFVYSIFSWSDICLQVCLNFRFFKNVKLRSCSWSGFLKLGPFGWWENVRRRNEALFGIWKTFPCLVSEKKKNDFVRSFSLITNIYYYFNKYKKVKLPFLSIILGGKWKHVFLHQIRDSKPVFHFLWVWLWLWLWIQRSVIDCDRFLFDVSIPLILKLNLSVLLNSQLEKRTKINKYILYGLFVAGIFPRF